MDRCAPEQQHLAEALKGMLRGVRDELRLHEAYAERWGVLLEHQQPSPATKAYVYYIKMVSEQHDSVRAGGRAGPVWQQRGAPAPYPLLRGPDAGAQGRGGHRWKLCLIQDTKVTLLSDDERHPQSLADVMSTLLPCLRLYAWLGAQLNSVPSQPGNPYKGGLGDKCACGGCRAEGLQARLTQPRATSWILQCRGRAVLSWPKCLMRGPLGHPVHGEASSFLDPS